MCPDNISMFTCDANVWLCYLCFMTCLTMQCLAMPAPLCNTILTKRRKRKTCTWVGRWIIAHLLPCRYRTLLLPRLRCRTHALRVRAARARTRTPRARRASAPLLYLPGLRTAAAPRTFCRTHATAPACRARCRARHGCTARTPRPRWLPLTHCALAALPYLPPRACLPSRHASSCAAAGRRHAHAPACDIFALRAQHHACLLGTLRIARCNTPEKKKKPLFNIKPPEMAKEKKYSSSHSYNLS